MKLSFEALSNVIDVNHFMEPTTVTFQSGNPDTLYFRLVDMEQVDSDTKRPLRYVPPSGASIVVNFNQPDSNLSFTRAASQPFANDGSIWSVPINPQDQIAYGGITVTLTIGSSVYTLALSNQILFSSTTDPGNFYC